MPKPTTLFLITLLVSFTLLNVAARLSPMETKESSSITQEKDVQKTEENIMDIEESCGGIDEDECLMRRTLQGRSDYIYTQGNNN
ncbi:hypothetical protein ACHQM5_018171 [Ranunculus cassubicifolius]